VPLEDPLVTVALDECRDLASYGGTVRARGLCAVLEQASRICGQNLLHLGLATLAARFPKTSFFLLE